MHRQSLRATLPASDVECSAHSVHSADPRVSLNLPGAHAVHRPPSLPKKPALHRHAVCALLPLAALEDGGHGVQVLSPVAPSVVEKVSAGQDTQVDASAAPSTLENFPAAQATHAAALVAPVVSRNVPAVQRKQAELPLASLKVPGAQATHGPPSGPV